MTVLSTSYREIAENKSSWRMWGIEKGGIGKGNLGFDCDVLLRM